MVGAVGQGQQDIVPATALLVAVVSVLLGASEREKSLLAPQNQLEHGRFRCLRHSIAIDRNRSAFPAPRR